MWTSHALHRLRALVVPEGVVVTVGLALLLWPAMADHLGSALHAFPVVVLAVGSLLAIRFDRGVILLALAVLVVAERGLALAVSPIESSERLLRAIAVLLPVNLVGVGFLRERGILSRDGAARTAVLGVQALAVGFLVRWRGDQPSLLDASFLPPGIPSTELLGDLGVVAWAAGLVLLLGRALLVADPVPRGMLWAAAASLAALILSPSLPSGAVSFTAFFAVAGVALVVATVETSHSLAYRDGLTGLPSRRSLDETLRRLTGGYTVAMVDIDRFKQLNDRHGHDVGDQVLRKVGAVLNRVGSGGRAFRYGGEEFAVLFPSKGIEDALPALERLRATIEDTPFRLRSPDRPPTRPKRPTRRKRSGEVGVTVSIGVAERDCRTVSVEDVIKAADQALYRAKRGGRNRVREGSVAGNGTGW